MRHAETEAEESYFVSMTDMLVGLIFIFIIMLMYYALQFKQSTEKLADAGTVRAKILVDLQQSLQARGVKVSIDTKTGVLRLPDEMLFAPGSEQLSEKGRLALGKLAGSLIEVLPCYTSLRDEQPPADCKDIVHRIETIYIEGHTDSDPFSKGGLRDNWDLSVARATGTYRELIEARPELDTLRPDKVEGSKPLLSVAGYADRRPVERGDDDAAKARNRRIDLRLVMMSPDFAAGAEIEPQLRGHQ